MFHQGSGVVWMEGTQGLSKQSYLQLGQSVELVATLVQEIGFFVFSSIQLHSGQSLGSLYD